MLEVSTALKLRFGNSRSGSENTELRFGSLGITLTEFESFIVGTLILLLFEISEDTDETLTIFDRHDPGSAEFAADDGIVLCMKLTELLVALFGLDAAASTIHELFDELADPLEDSFGVG